MLFSNMAKRRIQNFRQKSNIKNVKMLSEDEIFDKNRQKYNRFGRNLKPFVFEKN